MAPRVVAVAAAETVAQAERLMQRHEVRHLPVVRGARLVGILSDRDLRGVDPGRPVQDVMTLRPVSIAPDASVDEAACVMAARKISALPVVERGRIVGFLTSTDVLRAFVDLSGAAERTVRIIVTGGPRRGAEGAVHRIVHDQHGELKWIHRRGRTLHLRLKAQRLDDVVTALEAAGFTVAAVVRGPGK